MENKLNKKSLDQLLQGNGLFETTLGAESTLGDRGCRYIDLD